jgi:hypothetical protein
MKYRPTIPVTYANVAEVAATVRRGQWINLEGSQGRVAGVRNGCVWILWTGTAGRSPATFRTFCEAFKA